MQSKLLCLAIACLATLQLLLNMHNTNAMMDAQMDMKVVEDAADGKTLRSLSDPADDGAETNESEEDEEEINNGALAARAGQRGKSIGSCKNLQISQDGCETKHILYVIASDTEAKLGTQAGLGSGPRRFPIDSLKARTTHRLYWADNGKNYLHFTDYNSLGGVQQFNQSTMFHLVPGNRLKASRFIKGKRKYYYFKSDRNYCTNDIKIDLDINEKVGKYIIVEGCAD